MIERLVLDGSRGEGGGQILRSSLALSAVCQRPIELRNIRAGRAKPGLARQHLACVEAAAAVVSAEVNGAALRSQHLLFTPTGPPRAGDYHFDIGSAGSTGLVFQTILWPLLAADGVSTVVIEGGTHNPMAPPFDFLARTFLPILRRCGADVEIELERHGFYPRGGGRIRARITGPTRYRPLELLERGEPRPVSARVLISALPAHIASREAATLASALGVGIDQISIEEARASGPGNAVHIELGFAHVTELISGFGERGVPAERVAGEAADAAAAYLATDAPVGEHLADQLIIPLALAGQGVIRCAAASLHAKTNVEVVGEFLPVEIELTRERGAGASFKMRVHGK